MDQSPWFSDFIFFFFSSQSNQIIKWFKYRLWSSNGFLLYDTTLLFVYLGRGGAVDPHTYLCVHIGLPPILLQYLNCSSHDTQMMWKHSVCSIFARTPKKVLISRHFGHKIMLLMQSRVLLHLDGGEARLPTHAGCCWWGQPVWTHMLQLPNQNCPMSSTLWSLPITKKGNVAVIYSRWFHLGLKDTQKKSLKQFSHLWVQGLHL